MSKNIISLFVLFLLVAFGALAQTQDNENKGFGIGVIIGEPTGISLKQWTGRTTAIDAAAAWSFVEPKAFHIHADFLMHSFGLLNPSKGEVALYYGLGGRIRFQDETNIGVRVPIGAAYMFESNSFDIFLEVIPLLDLVPKTEIEMNAALGARFYFGK